MKKLILFAFVLFACTSAFAQIEKGDKNISFNALYMGTEGFGMGTISGKIGYYFTQNIEAGITPSISITKFGDESETSPSIGFYGTYNWLTQDAKLLPYAGAAINFIKFADETQTGLGVYGGSKYFVTEAVNIDGGLQLLFVDGNSAFLIQVGIGFLLNKVN
ncbi:MAG: hypothetical protein JNK18_15695 [Cyclobacteriaceae bacterium]|nr:hypothetical protein [Cyclobacteriaceae bacterium]